jgi:hypothetical protein
MNSELADGMSASQELEIWQCSELNPEIDAVHSIVHFGDLFIGRGMNPDFGISVN